MDERIIRSKLDIIKKRACTRSWEVGGLEYRTADHLAPGKYKLDGGWKPTGGEIVTPAGKTLFVKAKVQVPKDADTKKLYLSCDFDKLEGMLSVNCKPHCGVDPNHTRTKVPAGKTLDLEYEFMSVPESYFHVHARKDTSVFRRVTFVEVEPELEGCWYDVFFAWDACRNVKDERRKEILEGAVEKALLAIDLTLPDDKLLGEVKNARRIFKEELDKISVDKDGGRIFMTGHSHIDTVWLWPERETVRKCSRTFTTAMRLMEQYPHYNFTCSQPQLYQYVKEQWPSVYAEIKKWVKAGRWETTGGMWVETDCNVPSGESLVRQILHGLRFFREEFGTRPRTCWLPDVFGYPGSLPTILKGCGLDYFYTNKLHWQSRNPFPYHLFEWEAIDGTKVLAHIPQHRSFYCGLCSPEEMLLSWESYKEKAVYDEFLYPFGHGDGGGGATEMHIEFAKRAENFPGLPRARHGLQEEYFDDVVKAGPELPVWRGELYLETHRGTYTTQGRTKRSNRKCEIALRDAEITGTIAKALGGQVDMDTLDAAWKRLLLIQFHDGLPGSSIGMVYDEAEEDYKQIGTAAAAVTGKAMEAISQKAPKCDVLLFNTLSWSRNDVAEACVGKVKAGVELVDEAGRSIPAQVVGEEKTGSRIVFSPLDVPSMGYSAYSVREVASKAETSLKISASRMENRYFVMELDGNGEIKKLYDKRLGREVVAEGTTANQLQFFQDGPELESAWNVHKTFEKRRYECEGKPSIEVIEEGPVRGKVRVKHDFRGNSIVQDIVMYDSVPRIDFETHGEWTQRQVMLKAAFPVEVLADNATYEIQFGAIQRTTHNNTSWDQEKFEVCAHRWADISESGYGVSLMNDCKYGYDVKGNVLRITLLRGAEWPDPDADKGPFEFTYSLLPHSGDWREGRTVESAAELNVPLLAFDNGKSKSKAEGTKGYFGVEGPAVVETVKPADDGDGMILRLYEPYGGRGTVTVDSALALRDVAACNLVEEGTEQVKTDGNSFSFELRPYQVRTFRARF